MESTIFWDMMLCSFEEVHCCFKDPNCLHFQAQKVTDSLPACSTYSFILQMKVVRSSETSVTHAGSLYSSSMNMKFNHKLNIFFGTCNVSNRNALLPSCKQYNHPPFMVEWVALLLHILEVLILHLHFETS
jgi:hypothetical protein